MFSRKKLRFAVVGQGWFSQIAVLPAFAHADGAALAAIVSGDPVKRKELGKLYGVPTYPYEEYDALLASKEIDAVFIVLPNSMHCDYATRAAAAGVHVLCEKPMAANSEECRRMTAACEENGVKLMIAYRLHFEEGNLEAVEAIHSGKIGTPRIVHSLNTQQVKAGNTRLDAGLAGSPLMDIGVYCINASRYLLRADPVEVTGFAVTRTDERFREVPEAVSAVLRFPEGRLASFTCSFGAAKTSTFQVIGTEGDIRMDPAFGFDTDLEMTTTIGDDAKTKTFARRDHLAAEIVYFADCVAEDVPPEPNGLEGLADLRIIEAIERSIATGKAVALEPFPDKPRPGKAQMIHRPAAKEPKLVNAEPPG